MKAIIKQLQTNRKVFEDILKYEDEAMVLWKQAPEKWCLLEIICHLNDEECLDFRFRVEWVLEKPNQIPPAIDPIGWITNHDYLNQDYTTMLNTLLSERDKSIIWLKSLKNAKWNNAFEHPKLGKLTARHFLVNWLAHDYLHIKQILKLKYDYLQHTSRENLNYAGVWK